MMAAEFWTLLLSHALMNKSASESWSMKYSVTSSVKQTPFLYIPLCHPPLLMSDTLVKLVKLVNLVWYYQSQHECGREPKRWRRLAQSLRKPRNHILRLFKLRHWSCNNRSTQYRRHMWSSKHKHKHKQGDERGEWWRYGGGATSSNIWGGSYWF
jgi:hypothetical protein